MSRKPSAETELRNVKRELKRAREACADMRAELDGFRARATRAEQEAAEWRRRFDLLLEKSKIDTGRDAVGRERGVTG